MALPGVAGWMIDFRTAEAIFLSKSNERISHCVELCKAGQLLFCHDEEKAFRSSPTLKQTFIDDSACVCFPDNDVMQKCVSVHSNPICKRLFKGNRPAVLLTATAACRNFGVLSDHRSPIFATVYDLCTHFGVPTFSADEYFLSL
jgi:hypothetical protein